MTVAIALTLTLAAFVPQGPAVHAATDRYTVEALDTGGEGRAARVIISNNVTSRRHMLSINSTLGELRRAVISDDQERVLFLCEGGFAVVDPAGRVPADEIYATGAVAAPGGRWIAFQRFYPSTHPGPSDAIAIYDTKQSPENNHAAHPIAAERDWRAGWPVFPRAAEWKEASSVARREDAYVLSSPLAWERGQSQPTLFFSMRHGREETVVVAVPGDGAARVCWSSLPGDVERWRVKTLSLATSRSGERTVTVKSGATERPADVTIAFAPECSGQNP